MPRAGLTTPIVVRGAADLADEIGYDALTLTALASRLGVAVPSLYKHVESLDDLRRGVAIMAIDELGTVMRATRPGTSEPRGRRRPDAGDRASESDIHALALAYRRFVLDHPGRYAATVRAAPADDRELQAASEAALRTVLEMLRSSGLQGDAVVHAARALRAALHGFASLEAAGGFGLPQDVERSFEWMVEAFEEGLTAQADRTRDDASGV